MSEILPIAERFWPKVKRAGPGECWLWTASTDKHGYGQMSSSRGRAPWKSHRVSYELHKGRIPSGLVVRHRCDNPLCVNPAHLEIGTQADNAADMVRRGRLNPKVLANLNHRRALSPEQVAVAKRRNAGGESKASIARDFGVDRTTVSLYINGKRG